MRWLKMTDMGIDPEICNVYPSSGAFLVGLYLGNVGRQFQADTGQKAKQMGFVMIKRYFGSVLLLGVLLGAVSANAQGSMTRAGVLTCRTSASVGLIVGSHQGFVASSKRTPAGRKIMRAPSIELEWTLVSRREGS